MKTGNYLNFFKREVARNPTAVFHNADIYPPHYKTMNAVTWERTGMAVTQKSRLQRGPQDQSLHRFFLKDIANRPLGKWRREHLLDRLLYFRDKVHWKNYEAGYDVAELQPISDSDGTFLLQEYFVPTGKFDSFLERLRSILSEHAANVINISVRHATADTGTILSWAREDVFAFVLYHKQGTEPADAARTALWTRELTDAAIENGGSYYLPYQNHATREQFRAAYPDAGSFFSLKRQYDPRERFRNALWEKYGPTGEITRPAHHDRITDVQI